MTVSRPGHLTNANVVHFKPYIDPDDLQRARSYVGQNATFAVVHLSATDYELYVHDEFTPGGILVGSSFAAGAGTQFNVDSVTLAGTVMTITQENGNAATVDLASIIPPDVALQALSLTGNTLNAVMNNGTVIPVDLSALVGGGIVNLALTGTDLVATRADGTTLTLDLSPLTDKEVSTFTLTNDDVTLTLVDGTSFTLDLSKYQETLAQTGAYRYTFDDGEGGTTVIDLNLTALDGVLPGAPFVGTHPNLRDLLVAMDDALRSADNRIAVLEATPDIYVDSVSAIQSATDGSNSVITLTMSDGSTHSVTTQDADTDTILTSAQMIGNVLELSSNNGSVVTVDLTPVDTENASMNLSGNILQLTDTDGSTVQVDLSQFMDDTDTDTTITNQTFVLSGTVLTMNDSAGGSVSVDVSALANDTTVTNASLGFTGNVLQLTDTNGGVVSVDLGPVLAANDDDTTVTGFQVVSNNLVLTQSDGTVYNVNLVPLVQDLDSANGVADFDLVGTDLELTLLDGTSHVVDLSSLLASATNTTNVSMQLVGTTLSVTDSDGGTVQVGLASIADTDVSAAGLAYAEETRTLTVSVTEDGNTVSGSVELPRQAGVASHLDALASPGALARDLWNRNTNIAATTSQLSETNMNRVALSARASEAWITNRAAEPTAKGLMNADGSLGFQLKFNAGADETAFAAAAQSVVQNDNGGYIQLNATAGADIDMSSVVSSYPGQVLVIQVAIATGSSPYQEVRFDFGGDLFGICRRDDRAIRQNNAGDPNTGIVRMRNAERLVLYGSGGGNWQVLSQTFKMFTNGINWFERTDGFVDMVGVINTGLPGTITTVILPVQVVANNFRVSLSSAQTATGALNVEAGLMIVAGSYTTTSFDIANPNNSTLPQTGEWRVTRAALDYAAL